MAYRRNKYFLRKIERIKNYLLRRVNVNKNHVAEYFLSSTLIKHLTYLNIAQKILIHDYPVASGFTWLQNALDAVFLKKSQ